MEKFNKFYAEFKQGPQWAAMLATVEDSPWHREANVAVHTEMVIHQYLQKFAHQRSEVQNRLALIALLFHDVGKPTSEEVLVKKDGSGELYRRYAGHEQDSAIAFTEAYITSPALRELLTPLEARAVRWIIEHHLPYGLKNANKRQGLLTGTYAVMKAAMPEEALRLTTFFDCLIADAVGRISDNHEQKLADVETWINEVLNEMQVYRSQTDSPAMYLLVGPSGSGKSTWIAKHIKKGDEVISLDNFRMEFLANKNELPPEYSSASAHYDHAWEVANADQPGFRSFCAARTKEIFNKPGLKNLFIDNTNLSRKTRASWVEQATRAKMKIIGVEFWNTLDTLMARQEGRPDKTVPYNVVAQQQNASTCCWVNYEVQEVQLIIEEQHAA